MFLSKKAILSLVIFFSLFGMNFSSAAEDSEPQTTETAQLTFDQRIDSFMKAPADMLEKIVFFNVPGLKYTPDEKGADGETVEGKKIPFILIWLLAACIILTFAFKFINFRAFGLALRTVRGKYTSTTAPGNITHFEALSTALSATVGLGNIAGVAIAVSIGGPGATFWMILVGLLGMTVKFAECTLGVKYRKIDDEGRVHGGPMYYLSNGLAKNGKPRLGKFLAMFFALACVGGAIGAGNMFQVNQACQQFTTATGWFVGQEWIFGLIMATLVGIVIIGGIKRIAHVTSKLVPFMVIIYVCASIYILLVHFSDIPSAFGKIFSGAFSPSGIKGGIIGVMLMGIQRAIFSNEAGLGSSAIAHSVVKTNYPASEGIVALLEPFVDTVVVCTMTALVIIITGSQTDTGDWGEAINITSNAYDSVIPGFRYVLMIAVMCFAFSTLISWSYYGLQAWDYLFGLSRASEYTYKIMFCLFAVVGAPLAIGSLLKLSDSVYMAMCFPNLIGIYLLLPVVRKELANYKKHTRNVDSGMVETD